MQTVWLAWNTPAVKQPPEFWMCWMLYRAGVQFRQRDIWHQRVIPPNVQVCVDDRSLSEIKATFLVSKQLWLSGLRRRRWKRIWFVIAFTRRKHIVVVASGCPRELFSFSGLRTQGFP